MASKEEKMDDNYSIALFEDGTREMIPTSWIQEYLKEGNRTRDETPSIESNEENVYQYSVRPQYCITVDGQSSENIKNSLQGIVKELADVKSAVNQLQKSVDRLTCIAVGEPEHEVDLSRPAETLTELLNIEEHIKVKINYDDLMYSLSKTGGKTVESTTRKIWNILCTTQLASGICWTGANGKYSLKPLLLNKLVRDAVLVTHPQGKEADIQRVTMLWFSHAQDRLRTRKI